jgi:hypothetical protein
MLGFRVVSHCSAKKVCYDLYMALTYVISFLISPVSLRQRRLGGDSLCNRGLPPIFTRCAGVECLIICKVKALINAKSKILFRRAAFYAMQSVFFCL